jgi:apolipoprotein N-acyltransferase
MIIKTQNKFIKILISIFNALILSIILFLTAALLIESYLEPASPLLAWFAFIPFAICVLNIKSSVSSFFYGCVAGILSYLGIIYWIYPTVQAGTGSTQMAAAALAALSALLSLQFGIFGFLCNYLKRVKWLFPLAGACAWVALEILHQAIAYKFSAFPWFVLGYTQADAQALIQISAYTGVYGVSFLIMFSALSLAVAANGKIGAHIRLIYLVLPLLLVAAVFASGKNAIAEQQTFLNSKRQEISVALMQPDTHNLMFEGYDGEIIDVISEQSSALENKHLDLIVWPESSYPGSFQDKDYEDFVKQLSAKTQSAQITGSYTNENGKDYVSAGLFDETGLKDIYHKIKLVPFGEFLPFYSLLKSLYDKYGISSLTGTFAAGSDAGKIFNLTLTHERESAKNFTFGTQICFESLFPSIWRAQASNGAQFFVNISNDGWFLDTAAPYQHLRANIFRAVENKRPVLRAANTGISAWIDALGQVKFTSKLGKQETALLNFHFQPQAGKTFYTIYGDIFAYICALISATVFIYAAVFLNVTAYDRN